MEQTKRKLPELSYLNAWFCLVVIFIHIASGTLSGDFSPLPSDDKLYTPLFVLFKLSVYVVQGFIFLSSTKMFLKYNRAKLNYPKFLFGRIYKIIIPYIIWFFIYVSYLNYRPDYTLDGINLTKALWQGTLISHFYFITVITQFYVLMPLWIFVFKRMQAIILLPLTLLINVLAFYMIPDLYYYYTGGQQFALNSNLFTYYIFFWCAGAYTGLNYEKVCTFASKHTAVLFICSIISGAATALYSYVISIEKHIMYFTDILYILYQTTTIFMLLGLFCRISKNKERPPFIIRFISNGSYAIYLSHIIFIYAAEHYSTINQITDPWKVAGYRAIAAYGICILLCGTFGTIKAFIKKSLS